MTVQFIRKNWFSLSMPCVIGFSYYNANPFRTGGSLHIERYKDAAIMSIFLCSGLAIPGLKHFRSSMFSLGIRRHIWIQGGSLIVIPLFVAATASSFAAIIDLPQMCAKGAIFVSCLPTTIGLCVALTRAAGGDVLLATFHSAIGNSIGPFITPLTSTFLAGIDPTIERSEVVKKLMTLILLPLGVGMSARKVIPILATTRAVQYSGIAQQLSLLLILSNVFSTSFAKQTSQRAPAVGEPVAASSHITPDMVAKLGCFMGAYYTLFFFSAALIASRFSAIVGGHGAAVAAVYCGSQKTAAMGLSLLDLMFEGHPDLDLLVTPLLVFHMYQIVFGAVVGPSLLRYLVK